MNRGSFTTGIVLGAALAVVVGGAFWALTSRSAPPTSKPSLPAPADVGKIVKEDQLNIVKLRPEAVERLGLTTAKIETKVLHRTRLYGGDVIVPPGRTALVAAPFNGVVRAAGKTFPQPGQTVRERQVLLDLLPLLTPEGRANLASSKIDAEGQVRSAQAQVEAARITLERADRVFKSDAGSRKAVDDARAQFDLAVKTLEAATARSTLLDKVFGDASLGTATPLPIESPENGILKNLSAFPGQNVPAGAPLFEIIDLSRIWVRVPVFVGDYDQLDLAAPARIGALTADPREPALIAKRAVAPPSANPAAGTIDLFYELDNPRGRFTPGERVSSLVSLTADGESPVVPLAAIVHDIYGGAWVYEQISERAYARRRVVVRWIDGPTAVLASSPPAGTTIVVAGAIELFGAETGFTK